MTRSIFDPDGGETLQQGSRNLGPSGADRSHMPPRVVDGKVDDDERVELGDEVDLSENAPGPSDVQSATPRGNRVRMFEGVDRGVLEAGGEGRIIRIASPRLPEVTTTLEWIGRRLGVVSASV